MDEENITNSPYELPARKTRRKPKVNIKKPLTPYFLFCQDKRQEYEEQNQKQKLKPKELGQMWHSLSEEEKKPYIERYNIAKKEYDETVAKLRELMKKANKDKKNKQKSESDEEDSVSADSSNEDDANKKTQPKAKRKAPTKKEDNKKNNTKSCNCGECDDCKKKKRKKKSPKED